VADLALLVLTLFWGTTFTFVHRVLDVASPGVFLSARFALAVALLGAVALWRRDRLGPGFWKHGGLLGLFLFLTFAFQTVGLRHTTPARSGFITGLSVLVVPFVARFWLGRPVRAASWIGVALAVVGLAALTRPFGEDVTAAVRFGDGLTAICALACALQIALMSEWAPRHPVVPFTVLQLAVTLAGVVGLAAVETPRLALGGGGASTFWATVVFTGVVMTAGAFLIQNWGQARTTAVRAALIFSLEPVSAALFSHFYGGEPLARLDWLGGGLIVLGVIVGEVGGALEARADGRPVVVEPPLS
jgi:drug/metabolite transporter (DMT)-like permease